MKNRLPLVLALALAVTGCNPPAGGTGAAGGYDQKVAKVEQLTKTLSLTQNEELKQAATSMQTLGGSMTQGGFANATQAAGGLVAAGGGNMVAAGSGNVLVNNGGNLVAAGGGNYLLNALVQDLNAGVRKDVYQLMGTVRGQANSELTYDDATGELTGVSDGQTTATFKFVNGGAKRTWTIAILKSPDGTTGTMTFEVTADVWRAAPQPQPQPQPQAPNGDDAAWWGDTQPSAGPDFGGDEDPLPNAGAGDDDQADANGELGGEANGDETDDAGDDLADDDEEFELQQAAPAIKIFNNEVPDPNTLTAFRFACDLTPKGDASLRVKLDALIDDVKVSKLGRMPSHLKLDLTVPTVQFTSDTHFDGQTKFASTGGLKVRTAEASESLKYDLDLLFGENTGKVDLVHEGAKVRLGVVATKGAKPGQPETTTGLYDTESNQKIADVEPAKDAANVVLIKFTNGKVVRWDVASGTTSPLPGPTGSKPPTPPRASAAPRQ